MHAGLNLPDNSGSATAAARRRESARNWPRSASCPPTARARVALVFDYEASWITRIQPQGADFSYLELTFRWYEAVRRLGLDVDILAAGADLAGYALVLVPTLPHVGEAALAAFARAEGCVLFGPRSGSKTRHFSIPDNLPPGPLASLFPFA